MIKLVMEPRSCAEAVWNQGCMYGLWSHRHLGMNPGPASFYLASPGQVTFSESTFPHLEDADNNASLMDLL